MSRKIIKGLSLVIVLGISLFSAFGCDGPSTTDTEKQSGNGDVTSSVTSETQMDFGGREVRLAMWGDVAPVAGRTEGDDKAIARREEVEKMFNIKFGYVNVPVTEYLSKLKQTHMAGDPMAEVVVVDGGWFYPDLVLNGYACPVSDFGVFDFDNEEVWNSVIRDYATIDGKVYGFMAGSGLYPRGVIFFNKAIFDREGLEYPYELQFSKKWTWDKMLELAKAATRDTNGDGVIDQWGFNGDPAADFVASNDARPIRFVDGKPKFTLNEPNALEALGYYQRFVNDYGINEPLPEGATWEYPIESFEAGNVAMFSYSFWVTNRVSVNMEDDYGVVMFPMGPKATEYVSSAPSTELMIIPSSVKKPEEVAMVWNAMTYDPDPDEEPDPEAWKNEFLDRVRDTESMDTLQYMGDHDITVITNLGSFPGVQVLSNSAFGKIGSGAQTPAAAIEEISVRAQSYMDDLLANAKK